MPSTDKLLSNGTTGLNSRRSAHAALSYPSQKLPSSALNFALLFGSFYLPVIPPSASRNSLPFIMTAPNRFFACETRVVRGLGCISQLSEELSRYKISNPALVADAGIAKAGLLEKWLSPNITNVPARILAPMNPDLESVRKGIDVAKAAKCDGVVIVGGGSSICLGKAIAICLVNPGDILEYEGNEKMQNVSLHNQSEKRMSSLIHVAAARPHDMCTHHCGFWLGGIAGPCVARTWKANRGHRQRLWNRASCSSARWQRSPHLSQEANARCSSGRHHARLREPLVTTTNVDNRRPRREGSGNHDQLPARCSK